MSPFEIRPIQDATIDLLSPGTKLEADVGTPGFVDILSNLSQEATKVDGVAESYILGADIELHNVMIQMQKMKLKLQLATEIRNKIVEAYQEVTRMQV